MAAILGEGAALGARFAFLLASASPRRRELLQLLRLPFSVVTSGFAEDINKSGHTPASYVEATARGKCEAVLGTLPDVRADGKQDVVLCADTVVSIDGLILEKPADSEAAREMLRKLSGRTHQVLTGVVVHVKGRPAARSFVERTDVTFSNLTPQDIDAYVATGEPFDKAGGYGIQSHGSLLVAGITGDYFNVVGLPVAGLARLLASELSAPAPAASKADEESEAKRRRVEEPALKFIDKLALIVVRDRRTLMVRTRGNRAYYTPGGKREKGESDEEALAREVREELGVELLRDTMKAFNVFHAPAHGKPEGTMLRMTCYTASFAGEAAACSEIEELRWMASTADRSLLSTAGVMVLDDLRRRDLID